MKLVIFLFTFMLSLNSYAEVNVDFYKSQYEQKLQDDLYKKIDRVMQKESYWIKLDLKVNSRKVLTSIKKSTSINEDSPFSSETLLPGLDVDESFLTSTESIEKKNMIEKEILSLINKNIQAISLTVTTNKTVSGKINKNLKKLIQYDLKRFSKNVSVKVKSMDLPVDIKEKSAVLGADGKKEDVKEETFFSKYRSEIQLAFGLVCLLVVGLSFKSVGKVFQQGFSKISNGFQSIGSSATTSHRVKSRDKSTSSEQTGSIKQFQTKEISSLQDEIRNTIATDENYEIFVHSFLQNKQFDYLLQFLEINQLQLKKHLDTAAVHDQKSFKEFVENRGQKRLNLLTKKLSTTKDLLFFTRQYQLDSSSLHRQNIKLNISNLENQSFFDFSQGLVEDQRWHFYGLTDHLQMANILTSFPQLIEELKEVRTSSTKYLSSKNLKELDRSLFKFVHNSKEETEEFLQIANYLPEMLENNFLAAFGSEHQSLISRYSQEHFSYIYNWLNQLEFTEIRSFLGIMGRDFQQQFLTELPDLKRKRLELSEFTITRESYEIKKELNDYLAELELDNFSTPPAFINKAA